MNDRWIDRQMKAIPLCTSLLRGGGLINFVSVGAAIYELMYNVDIVCVCVLVCVCVC